MSVSHQKSERPVLVSANWKMHENHFEALKLVQELAALFLAQGIPDGREVSVHPPFTSIRTVQTAVESDHVPVALGAQNCHSEDHGAFTGEVSAEMLAKLNVRYVIAGHSERRQFCGETDDIVARKVAAILRHGMSPIVCVGETMEQRTAGDAAVTVQGQVETALRGLAPGVVGSLVVTYEPVWAIGSGSAATPADAEEMAVTIRTVLEKMFGAVAHSMRIQYGGSVSPESAGELLCTPNIDGLLVGGASLDANKFVAIVASGQ